MLSQKTYPEMLQFFHNVLQQIVNLSSNLQLITFTALFENCRHCWQQLITLVSYYIPEPLANN